MQQYSWGYTVRFSAMICFACSLLVSGAAVALKARQDKNSERDKQKNVLLAASLIKEGQKVSDKEIVELFGSIKPVVINLKTGEVAEDIDPATFDQLKATKDPEQSSKAPANTAGVGRLPKHALIYQVLEGDEIKKVIIPISGYGLWSTLYGFLALGRDGNTIQGITYYQHAETPGLGGEVDNPKWKAKWVGRKAFDADWNPKIHVIKGRAGKPDVDPHRVDGLSGATITSRGVSHMMDFWLGENGFGPFLEKFRAQEGE